jgi:hypothetical protein
MGWMPNPQEKTLTGAAGLVSQCSGREGRGNRFGGAVGSSHYSDGLVASRIG